jgi:hypothetical protein
MISVLAGSLDHRARGEGMSMDLERPHSRHRFLSFAPFLQEPPPITYHSAARFSLDITLRQQLLKHLV